LPHSDGQSDFIEQSAFWSLALGLAWVPFWYGSNDLISWGVNAILFPGLAAIYELLLLARGKRHPVALRSVAPSATLFGLAVVWIGCQTLTWPILPFPNSIWGMAADALPVPVPASISVDRDLTVLALVRLVTAASVFWVALQLCRDERRARRLIVLIAAIGCAYAAYGIVAAKSGHLPLLDIPPVGGRVTSTFYNRNSFATYAGLTLVAFAALLLRLYQREMTDAEDGWRLKLASFIRITGQDAAVLLVGAFITMVALLLTGSRGGVIATLLALIALGALGPGMRKRWRAPALVVALLLVLMTATLYAFGGAFAGSLEERGVSDLTRLAIYALVWHTILAAPLQGFGYGTFGDVFPMYRDRSISVNGVWSQAHNTYLEVLQDLGLVFGTLLIAAVVTLALRCVKGTVERRSDALAARVAAGAACLVGVQSLVDFSLQIQAVTLTFAAILGAGVAQSQTMRATLSD